MSRTNGVRYVLVADHTLMSDYRNLPLGQFLSCIPSDVLPARLLHLWLAPPGPHDNGRAVQAPTGLRRVEAALVASEGRDSAVVAHQDHVGHFIGPGTEVVGIHTMDPLGLGPVSMMFSLGGHHKAFTRWGFERLIKNLPKGDYRLAVGGAGTWQLEDRPQETERLGIDAVVVGEIDHNAAEVLSDIADGSSTGIVKVKTVPEVDDIPPNLGATVLGLFEVMRGCGRGCRFCQPNMRRARYIPFETVMRDIQTNVAIGMDHGWVLSDDIFLYKLEDHREVRPNREALVELFTRVGEVEGLRTYIPTHGSLAPVVADPDMIAELTPMIRPRPNRWIGIQPGLETGSARLLEELMPRKALPFRPDEWPDVVSEALRILNEHRWFPSMTLMVGLPGEQPEDLEDTIDLLDRLERESDERGGRFIVAPLSFVPQGLLRESHRYDVFEEVTPLQLRVIHRCWRHIVKSMELDLIRISNLPTGVNTLIGAVGRVGGRYILSRIERYGRRLGVDVAA